MSDFETLYGELYDLFYNSDWSNDELAAFKLQVGDNYNNGPLFIGRAPNGWSSFNPSEWERDDFIQDPMLPDGDTDFSDWLDNNGNDHYKISRSQFWQDAKRIFAGLYNGDFTTDIAYSNLCKISLPDANPTDEQCFLQLDVCRRILLAEITDLEPECIIFITGYNGWAEWFFDDWDEVNIDSTSSGAIKCSGDISGYPFVVIHHPQGKTSEARNETISQVIEFFQDSITKDDDENYDDDDDSYDDDKNYQLSSDVIQKLADIMCQYAPAMWSCITLEVYLDDGVFHFNCEALDTEDTLYDISMDDEDNECLQNTLLIPMSEQQLEFFRIEIDNDGNYSIEFV